MQRHRVLLPLIGLVFAASAAPVFASDPVGDYDEPGWPGRGTAPRTGIAPAGVPNVEPEHRARSEWKGRLRAIAVPRVAEPSLDRQRDDGSGAAQFTTNSVGTGDSWPEWSPGGTLLAFSRDMTASEDDGGSEIFTIHADKTGLKRLTNNDLRTTSHQRSLRTGAESCSCRIATGTPELYMMNIDGSNVRRITNNAAYDSQADWSPDGTKIAFALGSRRRNGRLHRSSQTGPA